MSSAIDAWLPKSVILLRNYDRHKFASDLAAGITVGLVALPLAMAFAISSGVSPQAGLYCAMVTGFLISALGGSKTQIGGPTGAFVVVVAGIIAKHGVDGLFVCTMMAGVLLVLLGVTGMGTAVKYFPRPVIVGFTNGIAILIASTQIKDFFGLRLDQVPGDFFHRMKALGASFGTLNWEATLLAVVSLAVMMVLPEIFAAGAGSNSGVLRRDGSRCADSPRCGNHRFTLRRNSQWPAAFRFAAISLRHRPATFITRAHRGHARSNRIADVGCSFRQA